MDAVVIQGDDALFDALAAGAHVENAAKIAKISPRAAYRRLAGPEFRLRVGTARQSIRDTILTRLTEAAGDAISSLWELVHHEDSLIQLKASKSAALRIANKLEADAALRRDGVIDVRQARFAIQAKRPLSEQLSEWKASLAAKENDANYVAQTCTRAQKVFYSAGLKFTSDLSSAAILDSLKELRAGGLALSTINDYLTSAKNFSRWLLTDKCSIDDPLVGIPKFNVATEEPRRPRRELSPDEFTRLFQVTEARTLPQHKISGPDRAMLYRIALVTGLRAIELRSLFTNSFDLNSDPPTVTVEASFSKRRRRDVQPFPGTLLSELEPWLAKKPPGQRLFSTMPKCTARMLQADLKAARAAWIEEAKDDEERVERVKSDYLTFENEAGEFADFHALRYCYVSTLMAGGASIKVVQELARHSDPKLTMNLYSHVRLHDVNLAVQSVGLPKSSPDQTSNSQILAATGTDNLQVSEVIDSKSAAHAQNDRVSLGLYQSAQCEVAAREPIKKASTSKTRKPQDTADLTSQCETVQERRAWESNPQPVSRHHISSVTASHSLTLRIAFRPGLKSQAGEFQF